MIDKYKELEKRNLEAEIGGGQDRIDRQHAAGRKTARERLYDLIDPGTFVEFDKFVVHRTHDFDMEKSIISGDGVVTGYGKIDGRMVYLFAQDFTVFGGTMSRTNADKIVKIMDLAMKMGAPVIGLNDSGGARIQEGVQSLAGYADIFYRNVMSSGVIPQISAILGPCAGGAVYSPAITDFIVMVKESSYMFVTGPDVVKEVTHEEVTKEELGGSVTHGSKSGVTHLTADDDEHAMLMIRELFSYLPSNNMEDPPFVPTQDDINREDFELDQLIPSDPNKPYDMRELITKVIDNQNFFEIQPTYAPNILIGFARMGGRSVGIDRGQPACVSGRCFGYQLVCKSSPVCPFLRRLQHPVDHFRGCARILARYRSGVWRDYPSRRQIALRFRGSHRPEDYHDHPESLRWRIRCDEQQTHRRRCQLCLSLCRDCRDGSRRRSTHHQKGQAGCRTARSSG